MRANAAVGMKRQRQKTCRSLSGAARRFDEPLSPVPLNVKSIDLVPLCRYLLAHEASAGDGDKPLQTPIRFVGFPFRESTYVHHTLP